MVTGHGISPCYRFLVVLLSVLAMACPVRPRILGPPACSQLMETFRIIVEDPALRQIQRETQTHSVQLCVPDRTSDILSSIGDMAPEGEVDKARGIARILRKEFRKERLEDFLECTRGETLGEDVSLSPGDSCTSTIRGVQLWISVSPVLKNPFASRGQSMGFFLYVKIGTARGVGDAFEYWIATEGAQGEGSVRSITRIARELDLVQPERVVLYHK